MLVDLILEKRRNEYLEFVQLTKKSFMQVRMIYALLAAVMAGFGVWFFAEESTTTTLVFAVIVGLFVGYKYPYFQLMGQKKAVEEKVAMQFPDFLQAFTSLQPTKRIILYTFQSSLPFVKEPLRSALEKLILQIEQEGDKREFYMEFAEYVKTPDAYTIMDQLYKFSVNGYNEDSLLKLQQNIKKIQENRMELIIQKKTSSMNNIGILPMISGIVFVAYVAGLILVRELSKVMSMF